MYRVKQGENLCFVLYGVGGVRQRRVWSETRSELVFHVSLHSWKQLKTVSLMEVLVSG